jgi:Transposase DDE domain
MKEFAKFPKGAMSYYFGIKFHIVIDYSTNLPIYAVFTKAKIDDRQVLRQIMEDDKLLGNTGTMFVADKGYQALGLNNWHIKLVTI